MWKKASWCCLRASRPRRLGKRRQRGKHAEGEATAVARSGDGRSSVRRQPGGNIVYPCKRSDPLSGVLVGAMAARQAGWSDAGRKRGEQGRATEAGRHRHSAGSSKRLGGEGAHPGRLVRAVRGSSATAAGLGVPDSLLGKTTGGADWQTGSGNRLGAARQEYWKTWPGIARRLGGWSLVWAGTQHRRERLRPAGLCRAWRSAAQSPPRTICHPVLTVACGCPAVPRGAGPTRRQHHGDNVGRSGAKPFEVAEVDQNSDLSWCCASLRHLTAFGGSL